MAYKTKFLKPSDENFKEDRVDTDGINNTGFIYNPYINQSLERQRRKLPTFNVRNHFLYLVEQFQTVLVTGETGSGKSTQLPQYLLESNWGADGIIGISQPRRVACTNLSARVAEEKDCILGELVGYCIRFDDCTTEGVTKIKYMTEGLLVREMMADPLLRMYSVIILDEVHERTLYTDIVLGLLKKILKRRKRLRLVVCSATYDANKFYNFFNFNKTDDKNNDTVALLSVEGRNFPILCQTTSKAAFETAVKLHKKEPLGDILIFLTVPCLVLPMHGSLPNQDQLKVFQSAPLGTRKIVVATNIAETSVTIPNIVYVIDCGFVKLRIYNPKSYSDSLIITATSKASAIQRAGRAGRTQPGKVYRLYPEEEYSKFDDTTQPEMVRTNLNSAVLSLMALGIDNMLRFDFPSPPPSSHLVSALNELFALGALNDEGQLSDPLGKQMAELPLIPQLSKMLLISGDYGCSEEIMSIISMLQVQNIFIFPSGKRMEAKILHRKFQVSEGDLITFLNIFAEFEDQKEQKKWCSENFLNYRALLRAKEMRNRIKKFYTNFNRSLNTSEGGVDPICRCITAGMFPNAAYLHYSGVYKTVRGNESLYIHPSSVLVLFGEVIHTNKTYMKDLTVIEESWLTEIAPHFYEKVITKDF
ncbi:putative ATP-dependent RNA helicase DHX35 [Armadillidium vulgare]|nr:putative ATP-dependent RNA helicase DHX35 [Armadillidium vulgare]